MSWRRVLTVSVGTSAICALVFWLSMFLGLVGAPSAGLMAYYRAIWVCFWGAAALGAIIPFVAAFAAWRHFSLENSN